MERRVFIAIVLSFLVLYGYQALLRAAATGPQSRLRRRRNAGTAAAARDQRTPAHRRRPRAGTRSRGRPRAASAGRRTSGARDHRRHGARCRPCSRIAAAALLHWRLKDYRDNRGRARRSGSVGLPADRATAVFAPRGRFGSDERLNNAIYRVSGDANGHVDATRSAGIGVVRIPGCRRRCASRKELRFDPHELHRRVVGQRDKRRSARSTRRVVWGPGPRRRRRDASAAAASSPATRRSRRRRSFIARAKWNAIAITKISEQPIQEGQFRFAGIDDHYFLIARREPGPGAHRVPAARRARPGGDATPADLARHPVSAAADERARSSSGRSSSTCCASIDAELVRAINFGIFAWLVVPLLGRVEVAARLRRQLGLVDCRC